MHGAFALENELCDGIVGNVGISRLDDVHPIGEQSGHEPRKICMFLKDPVPKQRRLYSVTTLEKNNYLYHSNRPLRALLFYALGCHKYIDYFECFNRDIELCGRVVVF